MGLKYDQKAWDLWNSEDDAQKRYDWEAQDGLDQANKLDDALRILEQYGSDALPPSAIQTLKNHYTGQTGHPIWQMLIGSRKIGPHASTVIQQINEVSAPGLQTAIDKRDKWNVEKAQKQELIKAEKSKLAQGVVDQLGPNPTPEQIKEAEGLIGKLGQDYLAPLSAKTEKQRNDRKWLANEIQKAARGNDVKRLKELSKQAKDLGFTAHDFSKYEGMDVNNISKNNKEISGIFANDLGYINNIDRSGAIMDTGGGAAALTPYQVQRLLDPQVSQAEKDKILAGIENVNNGQQMEDLRNAIAKGDRGAVEQIATKINANRGTVNDQYQTDWNKTGLEEQGIRERRGTELTRGPGEGLMAYGAYGSLKNGPKNVEQEAAPDKEKFALKDANGNPILDKDGKPTYDEKAYTAAMDAYTKRQQVQYDSKDQQKAVSGSYYIDPRAVINGGGDEQIAFSRGVGGDYFKDLKAFGMTPTATDYMQTPDSPKGKIVQKNITQTQEDIKSARQRLLQQGFPPAVVENMLKGTYGANYTDAGGFNTNVIDPNEVAKLNGWKDGDPYTDYQKQLISQGMSPAQAEIAAAKKFPKEAEDYKIKKTEELKVKQIQKERNKLIQQGIPAADIEAKLKTLYGMDYRPDPNAPPPAEDPRIAAAKKIQQLIKDLETGPSKDWDDFKKKSFINGQLQIAGFKNMDDYNSVIASIPADTKTSVTGLDGLQPVGNAPATSTSTPATAPTTTQEQPDPRTDKAKEVQAYKESFDATADRQGMNDGQRAAAWSRYLTSMGFKDDSEWSSILAPKSASPAPTAAPTTTPTTTPTAAAPPAAPTPTGSNSGDTGQNKYMNPVAQGGTPTSNAPPPAKPVTPAPAAPPPPKPATPTPLQGLTPVGGKPVAPTPTQAPSPLKPVKPKVINPWRN